MDSNELKEKLSHLRQLKITMREHDKKHKEAKIAYERYQAQIFDEMREEGFGTINHDNIQYTPKSTVFAHVQDDDKFQQWCRDQGLDDIFLSLKEESRRLNEYVRDALDNGGTMPEGVVSYERQIISISDRS